MSAHARRSSGPSTETENAVAVAENATANQNGPETENSAAQEEMGSGGASGLENYEAALGSWLGSELYDAVAPHVQMDKLSGYASQGLEAAIEGLFGALADREGVDEAAVKKMGAALADQYGELGGKWMEAHGQGLQEALAGWVDAHPRTIVGVALLAAAGAILADMDVPTIKQKFGIAKGLDASIKAELGSLRNLALEEIKAQLSWESGPLVGAMKATSDLEVTRNEDGEYSGKASASFGDEDKSIKANATVTEDGIDVYGVHGRLDSDFGDASVGVTGKSGGDPLVKASLVRENGDVTNTTDVTWDTGSDVLSLKFGNKGALGDNGSFESSIGGDTTGASTASFKANGKLNEDLTASGGITSTHGADGASSSRLDLGLGYKRDGLDASVNGWTDSKGTGELSGKVNKDFGNGLTTDASGKYQFGEKDALDLSLGARYRDDNDLLSARYGYKSNKDTHSLDLLAQRRFNDEWAGRVTGNVTKSQEGTKFGASAHGAYFFNKDVAAIAGGRYELDERGESRFIPEVGAQVNGVPITVGYDTRDKAVKVGLTLAF